MLIKEDDNIYISLNYNSVKKTDNLFSIIVKSYFIIRNLKVDFPMDFMRQQMI